jgi:uncharacterized OB-fold protein
MPTTSFRPDVFDVDRPALLAAHCQDCGRTSFPVRESCPACGSDREPNIVTLSKNGEVYSYTVVRQAPAGLKTPYVLAYVDLPADSVRVMARLETTSPEDVRVGMAVELSTLPLSETLENPGGASGSDAPVDGNVAMFAFRPRQEATR